MRVLIVESNPDLGRVWGRHLERQGADVRIARSEDAAIDKLNASAVDIIVLNLDLDSGGALAIAEYAEFRHPAAKIIFVTSSSFFADGSIFAHSANACACLPAQSAPEDLAALVEYHGRGAP